MNNAHALERGLLEEVTAHANLKRAWQRVKGNKGAAGCEEVSVLDLSGLGTRALADAQSRTGARNVCWRLVAEVWVAAVTVVILGAYLFTPH